MNINKIEMSRGAQDEASPYQEENLVLKLCSGKKGTRGSHEIKRKTKHEKRLAETKNKFSLLKDNVHMMETSPLQEYAGVKI